MTVHVFEGPDLAGKTTIVQRLKAGYDELGEKSFVMHFTNPGDVKDYELFAQLAAAISYAGTNSRNGVHVIIDRLHIGELVYGPVMRGRSKLTVDQAVALDAMLDDIGATKVFVDAPLEELLKRFDSRGETYISKDQLARVSARYRELFDLGTPAWNITRQSNSRFSNWQHFIAPVFIKEEPTT